MTLIDLVREKRAHVARVTNARGADGEIAAIAEMDNWVPRPKGPALKVLLSALQSRGISIKGSSFDAISVQDSRVVDFTKLDEVLDAIPQMCFVEIKSASQRRVKPGFDGYFFALTEAEIQAAEALGSQHVVALFNKLTGELLLSSVPEILARARSMNWQLSIQL